ncbi:DNA-binding transcriptional regulator YhcF (GntR family) [Rhizobium redzepovicii]
MNVGAKTYSVAAGLHGHGNLNGKVLEQVLKLPLTLNERESLVRWTPSEWDERKMNVGTESLRTFRIRSLRWHCDDCIRQDPYHRVWWDIRGFDICPLHDSPLVENAGSKLDQVWPYYGHTTGGIEELPPLSKIGVDTIEGYILQRLGAAPSGRPRPLLDDEPLDTVLKFAIATGRFLMNSYSASKPGPTSGEAKTGFEALCQDEGHLTDVLADWVARFAPLASYRHATLEYLGHYRYLISNQATSRARGKISGRVKFSAMRACSRFGTPSRSLRKHDLGQPPSRRTLSTDLQITRMSVSRIIERHGLVVHRDIGNTFIITPDTADKIRKLVEQSVSLVDVAAELGCSVLEAKRLASTLALKGRKGFIGGVSGRKIVRRYLREDLDDLVARLHALPVVRSEVPTWSIENEAKRKRRSVAGMMAAALMNEVEAFRMPGRAALSDLRFRRPEKRTRGKASAVGRSSIPSDAMSKSEFDALTRIRAHGVGYLLSTGHLKFYKGQDAWLERSSAMEFHARFINVIHYLMHSGLGRRAASDKVREVGLPLLAKYEDLHAIIAERSSFEAIIGPVWKPSTAQLGRWREFSALTAEHCKSLVVPQVPSDLATPICTSSRKIGFDVQIVDDYFIFIVDLSAKIGWRRKAYTRYRGEIHRALGSFVWEEDQDRTIASARASHSSELEKIVRELSVIIPFFRYKMP